IIGAFAAAGEGLAAAHQVGLMHRDFKPDNVIVSPDGRVRVLDFGLARTVGAEGEIDEPLVSADLTPERPYRDISSGPDLEALARDGIVRMASAESPSGPTDRSQPLLATPLTRAGSILGTPRYMSPEQHRAEPIDARTDQFSFCVALYEALYGKPPFLAISMPALRQAVTTGAIAPPPPGARVPRWLRQILVRG